ncbi:hypothetical protein BCR42DRAFT_65146 [Absidia repens]|uniref:Uncharacterized protein n=1 Tax=Absidia repens TaxID=90262 RepID=A0A1X2IBP7_9FUNG|nr:hypothetical protein BCR42DRAFT_65146 [Absidia repens]
MTFMCLIMDITRHDLIYPILIHTHILFSMSFLIVLLELLYFIPILVIALYINISP